VTITGTNPTGATVADQRRGGERRDDHGGDGPADTRSARSEKHGRGDLLRRAAVSSDDGVAAGEPTECFNPNAAVMRAESPLAERGPRRRGRVQPHG
jgi:hypothetical protein